MTSYNLNYFLRDRGLNIFLFEEGTIQSIAIRKESIRGFYHVQGHLGYSWYIPTYSLILEDRLLQHHQFIWPCFQILRPFLSLIRERKERERRCESFWTTTELKGTVQARRPPLLTPIESSETSQSPLGFNNSLELLSDNKLLLKTERTHWKLLHSQLWFITGKGQKFTSRKRST